MLGLVIAKLSTMFLTLLANSNTDSNSSVEIKRIKTPRLVQVGERTVEIDTDLFETLENTSHESDTVSLKNLTDYIDKRVSKILRKQKQ